MDTEYFAQRIQCSRNDKQDCLRTIYLLAEICTAARGGGVRALDSLMNEHRLKYSASFLNWAVQLYMDAKDSSQIRTVLYNCMISSNFSGPQFLNATIITEVLAALCEQEDVDYIFSFLVPSYFGLDFQEAAVNAYQDYRRFRMLGEKKPEKEKENKNHEDFI